MKAYETFIIAFGLIALGLEARGANRPVRLIAEAEDFKIERGWEVVPYGENYFASTFAITFLSRQACLGAAEQADAVAAQDVEIPDTGDYRVMARYEQPYAYSVAFTIEILQRGKTVYRRLFGQPDSPKYWAFQKGKQDAMKRWAWGGGDNIIWEVGKDVRLQPGKATIRLTAGSQKHKRAARRHVDVICLTNDKEGFAAQEKTLRNYLPFDGWLVQDGDLFLRVTNPKDGPGPCVPIIEMYGSGQHSPWWVHHRDTPVTRLVRSGRMESPGAYRNAGPRSNSVEASRLAPVVAEQEKVPESEYLQPGDTSGWAPMGQVLDSLFLSKWMPKAKYADGHRILDLELEFAIPDGKGGLQPIKKVRVKGKGAYPVSPIMFEMPGNVRANPVIRTQHEALVWLKKQVDRFPKKGAKPKRFPFYGIMGFSSVMQAEGEVGRLATEIAGILGDNTMTPLTSRHTQTRWPRGLAPAHWKPNLESVKKKCSAAEEKGTLDLVRLVSFGDEHYVPPVKIENDVFKKWLERKGVETDIPVKVTDNPDDPLFYHSKLCAFEKGVEGWAEATRYLADRKILAGINYGPASHNMVDEINFIRAFRQRGMSLAWSEDYVWQMPEFSVQVTGYRVSGFRAGATHHNTPILMYIMPHRPGNTPRDVRLSFYTAIAHGTTMVHYFCATPSAVGMTENYIATEDIEMFRTVHDLCRETGVFEDYVLDGTVRPAQVALLLSSVDDIRNPSTLQKGGHANANRKAIYYALRHAQVPVDFISEDDLVEGRAAGYKLIYVTQEYLHSRCVEALHGWVKAGGTLVAMCGGGFRDEFNRANPRTAELFGVKQPTLHKDTRFDVFQFKQDLPHYEPLDTASWSGVKNVPVILWKRSMVPDGGRVTGTCRDGRPAVIENTHGKGRAVLFGFMPALAYLKSGLPQRPWDRGSTDGASCHFLPTDMDVSLRNAVVDAFLPGDFVRPVECSEPLVESTCIDTVRPGRLAVPLMNYSGKPIRGLKVKLNGLTNPRQIRSVEQGVLKARIEDGGFVVEIDLDVTDMLLIDTPAK